MRNTVNETYHNLDTFISHCIICQKTLFKITVNMNQMVRTAAELLSYIRSTVLNHGEFMSLLQILDDEINDARYHSSIRCPRLNTVLKGMCPLQ